MLASVVTEVAPFLEVEMIVGSETARETSIDGSPVGLTRLTAVSASVVDFIELCGVAMTVGDDDDTEGDFAPQLLEGDVSPQIAVGFSICLTLTSTTIAQLCDGKEDRFGAGSACNATLGQPIGWDLLSFSFLVNALEQRSPATIACFTEVPVILRSTVLVVMVSAHSSLRSVPGERGQGVGLTVIPCLVLQLVAASTEDMEARQRGMQLGLSTGSFLVVGCVDLAGTGRPPMVVPSFDFSTIFVAFGKDVLSVERFLDAARETAADFLSLDISLNGGDGIGMEEGRRSSAFGTTVDAARCVCFIPAPRVANNPSFVDFCGELGGGFSTTAVLILGAYRFVEMLLTTNGLKPDLPVV